jgi:hypothetical protein
MFLPLQPCFDWHNARFLAKFGTDLKRNNALNFAMMVLIQLSWQQGFSSSTIIFVKAALIEKVC